MALAILSPASRIALAIRTAQKIGLTSGVSCPSNCLACSMSSCSSGITNILSRLKSANHTPNDVLTAAPAQRLRSRQDFPKVMIADTHRKRVLEDSVEWLLGKRDQPMSRSQSDGTSAFNKRRKAQTDSPLNSPAG